MRENRKPPNPTPIGIPNPTLKPTRLCILVVEFSGIPSLILALLLFRITITNYALLRHINFDTI